MTLTEKIDSYLSMNSHTHLHTIAEDIGVTPEDVAAILRQMPKVTFHEVTQSVVCHHTDDPHDDFIGAPI